MVLYDDKGLEIFDKITYNEDYYLTDAEMNIFERFGEEMAKEYVQDGDVLVELGCGSMRKTKSLLTSITTHRKNITYYAVDLSHTSLLESLKPLTESFPQISFTGLLGTYDDALHHIAATIPKSARKTYLWLGSSIGNLTREEAASFLRNVNEKAMEEGDLFICGIDRRNEKSKVGLAYNDRRGETRDFIMNGLDHVNVIFGEEVVKRSGFEYLSVYNDEMGRHEAYYRSLCRQKVGSTKSEPRFEIWIEEGELINVEYSVKYSAREVETLVSKAEFYHAGKYTDSTSSYDLHFFQKPPFFFPALSKSSPATPTLAEWNTLWKAWDTVTLSMIPSYADQPISLRHPFIFYLGHIPAFLDIQVSRCLKEEFTEPKEFTRIFERGIDPDVEDPEQCHDHSEVPEEWPGVESVLKYRDGVRERVRGVLVGLKGREEGRKRLERTLWMCYEHEAMHLETILYMLLQSPTVKPPHNVAKPILPTTTTTTTHIKPAKFIPFPNPPSTLTIGIEDPEENDFNASLPTPPQFGWDNEKPPHTASLKPFALQSRKVTNGEYFHFLASQSFPSHLLPASWIHLPSPPQSLTTAAKAAEPPSSPTLDASSHYGIKTVFGVVELQKGWKWPVSVSGDQASAYAVVKGGRLPTEAEWRFVRGAMRRKESDGVETEEVGRSGFRGWGVGDVDEEEDEEVKGLVGDGWELTGTVFDGFEGFRASEMYPGYSEDFFDGKHNVVVGGSWATVPRISGRESFRNWYQRSYLYVFAGFRLARDL
ncbi:hypothetical protein HK097_003606 [Rhizophlyctis rosea]|uniref:Uncharacterized protein n=1 Tax=Rhizophlyctis rosea TaxID=64517 RepID=A0AAD5WZY7_9FUNG|nr:hypothetical protein HK097_003606 [Rhizophlyctis rosea]